MKDILLIDEGFHPLLSWQETIFLSLKQIHKTLHHTISCITLSAQEDIYSIFLFLYEGQNSYFFSPYHVSEHLQSFWTWVLINDIPTAYINYKNLNIDNYRYNSKINTSEEVLIFAIETILSTGIRKIIIDTKDFHFNLLSKDFEDSIHKMIPYRFKKHSPPLELIFLSYPHPDIISSIEDWNKKKSHNMMRVIPIQEWYSTILSSKELKAVKFAMFIRSSTKENISKDYLYFLDWANKNNIPYIEVVNDISDHQKEIKNKNLLKQYFLSKLLKQLKNHNK